MLPFISDSFVPLLCLALIAVADLVKQVRVLLALLSACVRFSVAVQVCVRACAFSCACVSEVGLAEMSKARSHAVSAAADIALAVGGLTGGTAESERIMTRTHPITDTGQHTLNLLLTGYNWIVPEYCIHCRPVQL